MDKEILSTVFKFDLYKIIDTCQTIAFNAKDKKIKLQMYEIVLLIYHLHFSVDVDYKIEEMIRTSFEDIEFCNSCADCYRSFYFGGVTGNMKCIGDRINCPKSINGKRV